MRFYLLIDKNRINDITKLFKKKSRQRVYTTLTIIC